MHLGAEYGRPVGEGQCYDGPEAQESHAFLAGNLSDLQSIGHELGPRTVVTGQAALVIDHADFVGEVGGPAPEDQVPILRAGAMGKTGHYDACGTLFDQSVSQCPGGHCKSAIGKIFPCACQIRWGYAERDQRRRRGQVEDVGAIDSVTAQSHGLRLKRKALLRFEPGRFHAQ